MKRVLHEKKMLIIICFTYIISVFLRSLLIDSVWYKIWGDELLYNDVARSFIESGTFKFANMYGPSDAYLYPLTLSIVLKFFYNAETVSFVTRLFGIIVMSSVVFPTYLLAKKMKFNELQCFLFSIVAVLVPDMMQSLFYVTEIVAYPLFIWTIYFFYADIETDRVNRNTIMFALLVYLSYQARSLNLAILAGYFLYILIMCFTNIKQNKKHLIKMLLYKFIVVFGMFKVLQESVAWALLKFGVVTATETKGANSGFSLILGGLQEDFLYSVTNWSYNVILYLFYVILAFGFFVVVIPLLYRFDDKKNCKLVLFINLLLLCFIGAVVIIIQAREDPIIHEDRRIHMRYLFYFFIPYLLLLYKVNLKNIKWTFVNSVITVVFLLFGISTRYINNVRYTVGAESMMLTAIKEAQSFIVQYPNTEGFLMFLSFSMVIVLYVIIRACSLSKFLQCIFPFMIGFILIINNVLYVTEIQSLTIRGNGGYKERYSVIAEELNQYQQGEVILVAETLASDNEIQSLQLFLQKSIDKISLEELHLLINESEEEIDIRSFERTPFVYAEENGHYLNNAKCIGMRQSIATQFNIANEILYEDSFFVLYKLNNGKLDISLLQ